MWEVKYVLKLLNSTLQGHVEDDVNLFAEWGIDSLKLDGCYDNVTDFPVGMCIYQSELVI